MRWYGNMFSADNWMVANKFVATEVQLLPCVASLISGIENGAHQGLRDEVDARFECAEFDVFICRLVRLNVPRLATYGVSVVAWIASKNINTIERRLSFNYTLCFVFLCLDFFLGWLFQKVQTNRFLYRRLKSSTQCDLQFVYCCSPIHHYNWFIGILCWYTQ